MIVHSRDKYPQLSQAVINVIRNLTQAELVDNTHSEYNFKRQIFNGAIDSKPQLIVQCRSNHDIQTIVKVLKDYLPYVGVRGGGHSIAGNSSLDGGVVIDLSLLRDVTINTETKTATVSGGALLGDLDRASHEFGMAAPLGTVSLTGVTGLALGGGIGWLMGRYGLACDNIKRAHLILADGTTQIIDQESAPDLLWGLKGGGGNFGVISDLTLNLYPIEQVFGGSIQFYIKDAVSVLRSLNELIADCPDELTLTPTFTRYHGQDVLSIDFCFIGKSSAAAHFDRTITKFATPANHATGWLPFPKMQSMFDHTAIHGEHRYAKSCFLLQLTEELCGQLVEAFIKRPSRKSTIFIEQLHGAVLRVPEDATAFPGRSAHFNIHAMATWLPSESAEANKLWVSDLYTQIRGVTTKGAYLNYEMPGTQKRLREVYGSQKFNRLLLLKQKYDPKNFFRVNHNINPLLTD
jgi:hypothetical protein